MIQKDDFHCRWKSSFGTIGLERFLNDQCQWLAAFITPVEVAGTRAGGMVRNPVIKIRLEVFAAFASKFANRAVGAETFPVVEKLIARLVIRCIRQDLPYGLVIIDRFHRNLVNYVDHLLHVVQQVAQMLVFLFDLRIRIMWQQDIAENDGKDTQTVDNLLREFARLCAFKADASQRFASM